MLRLILATLLVAAVAATSYDGYKVVRITPNTEQELESSKILHETLRNMVDFWKDPVKVGKGVDMMISPENQQFVLELVAERGFSVEVIHEDLQKDIDNNRPGTDVFSYTGYNTLAEINAWMDELARLHPALVSVVTVGSSFEGRTIRALKLGKAGINKNSVWYESGIHPREWIASAATIYATKLFVDGYGVDPEVTDILDSLDVYILPIYNVDGYEFTHTTDRLWRKTRSELPASTCYGVDPNRNWDYQWGGESNVKCSETYQGPNPHSEIELQGVTSYIQGLGSSVKAFIDFHAYGNMWMVPWGYTTALPPLIDHNAQQNLAQQAADALFAVHGQLYEVGPIATVIYIATGSSADWAYGAQGILQSHAVEGRGNSFIVPEIEIQPAGEENFAALKVISLAVK